MRGFTLLYAVLISSIVLTIGLGTFSLVYGEIVLASNARDSAVAIYAADAGIECALFWDYNNGGGLFVFRSVQDATPFTPDTTPGIIYCFGDTIGQSVGGGGAEIFTSNFSYTLSNGAHVEVSVLKDEVIDGDAGDDTTIVHAYGRNTPGVTPRTAERVLKSSYRNPY